MSSVTCPVRTSADVVVVGAGIIGAACAYELAGAGLEVCVVERGAIASGTTGAGEGNVLLSDKVPGPALTLAQLSLRRWLALDDELDDDFELEAKGALLCADSPSELAAVRHLALLQADAGVKARDVTGPELWQLEPGLSLSLDGGIFYPEELQVQPMRGAAALLRGARQRGARVLTATDVREIRRSSNGAVAAVRTPTAEITTPVVLNAAGCWSAGLARLAGSQLPIKPRRGVILVTEPLPPTVFHKVYGAQYVEDVVSGAPELRVSTVIEATASGTVLIGSSRELVGLEDRVPSTILRRLAAAAVAMFPALASVNVIRAYRGFRPFSPDHLPVIGPDPRVPGLWHACGHEGSGICLAPGTALLVAAGLAGTAAPMDSRPFSADRFEDQDHATAET